MANTNLNNILSEEKLKAAFIQFDLVNTFIEIYICMHRMGME